METRKTIEIDDFTRGLVNGRNAATLTTLNPDGQPQSSVIFVGLADGGDKVVFSTIKGRRKTRNMIRDPRISLVVSQDGNFGVYSEIRGTVELVDDLGKTLEREMYRKYFGADASPPLNPAEERLIATVRPSRIIRFPQDVFG